MSTRTLLRRELVRLLKGAHADYDVSSYPDDPRHYDVKSLRGTVLVRYEGADRFDVAKQRSGIKRVRFEVTHISRNLHVHAGRATEGIEADIETSSEAVDLKAYAANEKPFAFHVGSDRFDTLDVKRGLWYYTLDVVAVRQDPLDL